MDLHITIDCRKVLIAHRPLLAKQLLAAGASLYEEPINYSSWVWAWYGYNTEKDQDTLLKFGHDWPEVYFTITELVPCPDADTDSNDVPCND